MKLKKNCKRRSRSNWPFASQWSQLGPMTVIGTAVTLSPTNSLKTLPWTKVAGSRTLGLGSASAHTIPLNHWEVFSIVINLYCFQPLYTRCHRPLYQLAAVNVCPGGKTGKSVCFARPTAVYPLLVHCIRQVTRLMGAVSKFIFGQ